jgi:hypothetical protein
MTDNRPSGDQDGVVRLRVSDEEFEGWLTPASVGGEIVKKRGHKAVKPNASNDPTAAAGVCSPGLNA